MNFSRKTILVVGAALLAACGDKVSVQEYTPPASVAKVNSVEVSPGTASMLVGESAAFTAAVNADAGVAVTVTWSSSDASAASVSATGVVTALKASPGVAICATSTVDTGKKGCATVAVRAPAATSLTVAPSSASLNVGQTVQLTAALSGATGTATWTTSDATKATVSSTGLVTAVAATPGVAVCAAAAGFSACATIVVNAVSVTGVTITPTTATLAPGEFLQLTASVSGSNGATNTFNWTSSDVAVTVDATGKVTAVSATQGANVCATSTQDASKRACASIIVRVPTPTGLSVTPSTAALNIGQTAQLTATVSGPAATPTWTSAEPTKVSVSETGLVTALAATAGTAVCASVPGLQTCSNIIVNGINVTSVAVTPGSAQLYPGDQVSLQATVSGTGGVTNTVDWSSADANVTVDATGKVTAVAVTAGAAVCATSTQDATKRGCAQITVVARPVLTPASVSINSIKNTLTGLPQIPTNVVGNIDVTLNVNPGSYTISKVELLVGGVVAGTQTFSVAQAAALRYAAEQAVALQTTFPQIVFTVNTAAFDATTGIPTWENGIRKVSARVYTGSTSSAASASAEQDLTFNNPNTFAASTSVANGQTANSAAGFTYTRGDLSISLIPVTYNAGQTLASANVNFGLAACDGSLTAQRTIALTAPVAPAKAWTATFAAGAAAAAGNLTSYEFVQAGACPAGTINTGERFTVINAQDATGASWVAGLPIAYGSFYRIDNLAPTAPTVNMTVGRRTANWVNQSVLFNRTLAQAPNQGIVTGGAAEAGVGLSTTETLVYTATVAGQGVQADASTLAETVDNLAYSITVTATDLVGNVSPASVAATFGVDKTAPLFPLTSPATTWTVPGNNAILAAAPNASPIGPFTYSDAATLPAAPSTPSATPVRVTITRREAAATLQWDPVTGDWLAAGDAFNINRIAPLANIEPALPATATSNAEAYYVITAFLEDGAGNPSTTQTQSVIYDVTAPTGPFSIPIMTASAGQSNLFSSTMTDNLSLATSQWKLRYDALEAAPGVAGSGIALAPTTLGAFLTTVTSATDAANYPLYRTMTASAGGAPVFPYVPVIGAQTASLQSVAHQTTDNAGLLQTFAATDLAIPAANLPAVPVADPYATAAFAAPGFAVTNANLFCVDVSGNASTTTANNCGGGATLPQNSVNLTATATGTVSVMPNPFVRVDFFVYNTTTANYHLIGSATTPTVVDNATNRVYTWTLSYNPDGSSTTPGGAAFYNNPNVAIAAPGTTLNIIAIGYNATFDAVRTPNNTAIRTVP